jgi:hypothetical protein
MTNLTNWPKKRFASWQHDDLDKFFQYEVVHFGHLHLLLVVLVVVVVVSMKKKQKKPKREGISVPLAETVLLLNNKHNTHTNNNNWSHTPPISS